MVQWPSLSEQVACCTYQGCVVPAALSLEWRRSRFQKLSQTIRYCQHPIVWVPKYRSQDVKRRYRRRNEQRYSEFSGQHGRTILEMDIQGDYAHLLATVPPGVSVSDFVGHLKEEQRSGFSTNLHKPNEKPYCAATTSGQKDTALTECA